MFTSAIRIRGVGFVSDDFKQEDGYEENAVTICYLNYGVTFTVLATDEIELLLSAE